MLKRISDDKLYAQPTYKDRMKKTDVLTVNPGKDIHKLDLDHNKKHFKKGVSK